MKKLATKENLVLAAQEDGTTTNLWILNTENKTKKLHSSLSSKIGGKARVEAYLAQVTASFSDEVLAKPFAKKLARKSATKKAPASGPTKQKVPTQTSLVQFMTKNSIAPLFPRSAKLTQLDDNSYRFSASLRKLVIAQRDLMKIMGRLRAKVNNPRNVKIAFDKTNKRLMLAFDFDSGR